MILRAFAKPTDTTPPRIDNKDIARLYPFTELHEQMLQTIAEHSEVIEVPAGEWEPPRNPDWQLFLNRGKLILYLDERERQRLRHEDPAAGFPLATGPHCHYRLPHACRILRIPSRYLALSRASQGEEENVLELHDDDREAALYLHFRKQLENGHFELPVMPELAIRIGKALDDPNTINEDVSRLVQLDPALSARVMRMVNSAAISNGIGVTSLTQAVARLGRQQVRNLVFSCIIKDLFRTDSRVLKDRMEQLWRHSCRVAAISSLLARFTPGLDADRGLLAGLVHDIGVIPLLHAARDMPELIRRPAVLDRLITEMKGETGQLTLQHWGFDEELAMLARDAEHWYRLGTTMPDYLDVVLVAQLHAYIGQGTGLRYPAIDQVPSWRKLALGKLTPQASIAVLDEAAREIDEIEQLLR